MQAAAAADPKLPGKRVGAAAALVPERGAAERHRQPAPDVVPERHGAQVVLAARAQFFAERQGRRHDRRAGMRLRRPVRIVGLVRMREDAVDECGVDRPGHDRRAGDGGDRTSGLRSRQRQRGAARRQLRAGDHRREGVENVMLGLLDDVRRQAAVLCRGHVGAERGHHRTDGLRSKPDRRQGGRAEDEGTALEQVAARES